MPNTYEINLINQNVASTFAFFQAPPEVKLVSKTGRGGSSTDADSNLSMEAKNIFSNIWVSRGCDAGGQITVVASVDFYSWAGDATEKAAVGVTISSGKALPATLGVEDQPGSTFDVSVNSDDIVVSKVVKSDAPGGTFQIITQSFKPSSVVIIGMAKPDADNPLLFRPTAVINAKGNMIYSIKPINNFYVAKLDSGANVGKIVDFKTVSNQKGLISFSDNPGTNVANVILDDEGTFQVSYT